MKKIKRILASFMVAVMILTAAPLSGFVGLDFNLDWLDFNTKASAATASGTCGSRVYWSFDDSTGVLSITGSGAMNDYYYEKYGNNNWGHYQDSRPWRNYKDAITSVVIDNGVTAIGKYAFTLCSNLTSVSISDSVTLISDNAFSECSSLTAIEIPVNVSVIGDNVFYGCSSLAEITVDSYNKYFCNDNYGALYDIDKTVLIMFPSAKYISNYVVPDSVVAIGSYAFSDSNLENIIFGNNVITICEGSFQNCYNLTELTVPDSVTTIESNAFYSCIGIENINFGNSVSHIGDYAFYGCSSLKNLDFPDSVTFIGDCAFGECLMLKTVNFGNTNELQLNYDSFGGCKMVESYSIGSENNNYCSDEYGVLYTKDKSGLMLYPAGNKRTSYTVDANTVYINDRAFENSVQLKNVILPDGLMSIGWESFKKCTSLTEIVIPVTLGSVDNYAFESCGIKTAYYAGTQEQWNKVVLGEYNENLENNLIFEYNSERPYYGSGMCGKNLTWILYTDGELVIEGTGRMYDEDYRPENYYYYNYEHPWSGHASEITSVSIAYGATTIGRGAFGNTFHYHNYENLRQVTIPESISIICESAFAGCYSLEQTQYSGSAEQWNSMVIESGNNYLLRSVILESDSERPYYAPVKCGDNLIYTLYTDGELVIEGSGPMYNYSFGSAPFGNNSSSINAVTISDGVTTIGDYAFTYCTNLTSVTISDSVTIIGNYAFYDCHNLTSITIPDSVTIIGNYVFFGCDRLTSVTIPDSVTTIGDHVFTFCDDLESVFLPESISFIGSNDFGSDVILYYPGTPSQWDLVEGNAADFRNNIVYESNSERPYFAPGKCGENLTYILYTDGELIISGTGAMYDFVAGVPTNRPWGNNVKSVVIEPGVTNIGKAAFYTCGNLTKIVIPSTVLSIGDFAFDGCTSLENINIPDSVTSIGYSSFESCQSLKSITIPDSITSISSRMFLGCSNLSEIKIPETVTSIGGSAFCGCTELTKVTIPRSVSTIGDTAFCSCPNLEEVVFMNSGAVSLGNNLFNNSPKAMICCEENSWLHFYASSNGLKFCLVDNDGNPAFEIKNNVLISYRGAAEQVTVSLVNQIGYGAFENNSTIKNIEIAKSINIIYNNAFKNCTELKSVIIPQSVTSIGATAFDGCDGVTIWCYAGSYADEYAQSHNIDVEYITLKMDKDVVHLSPNGTMTITYSFNTPIAENASVVWESTDKSVVTVDAFGNIKGVKAGTAVVVATSKDGSMRDYCVVKVVGIEVLSTVTIDYDNGFITGIESNTTSLDGLIAMTDSTCSLSYTTLGTDSVVYVQREGEIVDAYTVLIFGDVNGDGWYDGTDSIIVSCLANGLLTQDSVSEAVYRAADCNHDGTIDSFDVALLEHAGLLLSDVDQSKSNEELATDAAYIEYLDLIDQTPEIEVEEIPESGDSSEDTETPEVNEEVESDEMAESFDFMSVIATIFDLINKLFSWVFSLLG